MSDEEDDDGSDFMVGFVMGLVGSLAGLATAVSIRREYLQPAALGAAANFAVIVLLLILDWVVPGSVFGFMAAAEPESAWGPGPLAIILFVAALVVLLSMGVMRFLADRQASESGFSEGGFLGLTEKDVPTVLMALAGLLVVAVGAWWLLARSDAPARTVVSNDEEVHGDFDKLGGATLPIDEVDGEDAPEGAPERIRCFTPGSRALQGRVEEIDPRTGSAVWPRPITAAEGGAFTFRAQRRDGEGMLHAWGFEPVRIDWSSGACRRVPVLRRRPGGTFRVEVGTLQFVAPLEVTACGGTVTDRGPGVIIPVYDVDEDCTVQVSQVVSGVRLEAPPVAARGQLGEEVRVVVEAPSAPALDHDDPGWRLAPDGDVLRVEGVYPHSEAARAGIAPGDRVVELSGQPWPGERGAIVRLPVTAKVEQADGRRRTVRLPVEE